MSSGRFTETQIIEILKEAQAGGNNIAICQKYRISDQTFYRWRLKFADKLSGIEARSSIKAPEDSELVSLPLCHVKTPSSGCF